MRPSSFKRDGWVLVIPVVLIVSGFLPDPFRAIAVYTVIAGCLCGLAVSIALSIIRHQRAKTSRPDEVASVR
jgi:hypothetical protein